MVGPFLSALLPNLQVDSFGVVPKKDQPGKWQLIADLSSTRGSSVNSGIHGDGFSMHYIKLDQIIHMVAKYRCGAMMAKFDVGLPYHSVAIDLKDCYLLVMKWQGQFLIDLALLFGLCSAPVADMIKWMIINKAGQLTALC